MRPVRLLLLLGVGAFLLVAPGPASAGPRGPGPSVAGEATAVGLLDTAARAARTRTWSGTQYVSTWRAGRAGAAVLQVAHDPATGTRVTDGAAGPGTATPPVELDGRLLGLLADRYDLVVAGNGTCAGRDVRIVEARRDGRVAGRTWLDQASGLAVRQEVYDDEGARLRSSVFADLTVEDAAAVPLRLVTAALPVPRVEAVGSAGWDVPAELPGGFALLEAGRPGHDGGRVLHLAYSDGLSTLSLFSQPGSDAAPRGEYAEHDLGGTTVWVSDQTPERVVWTGGGQVFTLVSDAAHQDLLDVVAALPRAERVEDGAGARLRRGIARVGSWFNPFG